MYEDDTSLSEMGNAPGEAPEGQSASPDIEQQARSMGWGAAGRIQGKRELA